MKNLSPSVKAYLLVTFLTLLNILNFVDRQLLASFGEPVTRDLGLTDTQFGLLTGIIFVSFYATAGIFMGTLADLWNRPRLIAAGLFIWSLLTTLTGAAKTFTHLATARLLIGAGEATLSPAALSMLNDVFPPKRRAFAAGFYYAGYPLGVGASLLIAGSLGPRIGWQNCFYLLGALGLTLTLIVWTLTDPPRGGHQSPTTNPTPQPPTLAKSLPAIINGLIHALTHSPALVLTILGAVLIVFANGTSFFDQIWLIRERGLTQQQAGLRFGLIFITGGLTGNFLGGICADHFHKRRPGGRLMFLAIAQAIVAPFTIALRLLPPDTPLFYLSAFLMTISVTLFPGPVFASIQDLVPTHIRATAIAFTLFCINLLGLAPGAYAAGRLSDTLRAQGTDTPLTWALLIVGLAAPLAILPFLIAATRYNKDLTHLRRQ